MRSGAVVAVVFFVVGCGGTPTAPAPQPIPVAALQLTGQGSFAGCSGLIDLCAFQASIQNTGLGCATGTTVVARFFDGNNVQIGSDLQMGAMGGSLTSRTIRPQEIVALASVQPIAFSVASASKNYRLFPSWTDVRCP